MFVLLLGKCQKVALITFVTLAKNRHCKYITLFFCTVDVFLCLFANTTSFWFCSCERSLFFFFVPFMLILFPKLHCKLLKGKNYYLHLYILNIFHMVLTTWYVLLNICWPINRTLNSYLRVCGARKKMVKSAGYTKSTRN